MELKNTMSIKNLSAAVIICLLIGLSSCDKNEPENGSLKLDAIDYTGCFVDHPEYTFKMAQAITDTLFFSIEQNTLCLNMIINYNCCGLLSDSVVTDNREVNIFIADTCREFCECWCICDYGFEYKFTGFQGGNTHFSIYLKPLNDSQYQFWNDIIFIDGSD
ncbi:MAG: hypothetical protein ABIA75_05580 [Candidatus Neomarinimicrobiota bacterium]